MNEKTPNCWAAGAKVGDLTNAHCAANAHKCKAWSAVLTEPMPSLFQRVSLADNDDTSVRQGLSSRCAHPLITQLKADLQCFRVNAFPHLCRT